MAPRRRHIVVVEDAPDTLELLGMVLADDYEVTECSTCEQALSVVVEKPPDLLLMDIGLSPMNGIECLQEIRRIPRLENVPAIAVTAMAYPADESRCREAGFQAFFAKPILDYAEMRRLIQEMIEDRSLSA